MTRACAEALPAPASVITPAATAIFVRFILQLLGLSPDGQSRIPRQRSCRIFGVFAKFELWLFWAAPSSCARAPQRYDPRQDQWRLEGETNYETLFRARARARRGGRRFRGHGGERPLCCDRKTDLRRHGNR